MPARRSRRQDLHSSSGCPLPNKFDESYERFRENFKRISRRYANLARMPDSSEGVIIDMNDLTAISKTPNIPTLPTFGSGSSKLCFPDFSWMATTSKRPTFDNNSPCDEPTALCMSRCNSSRLAVSMESCCTKKRTEKKIIDRGDAEEKTAVKKDPNMAPASKDCERKAGKSKIEPAKVCKKSEVKAESDAAHMPLADKQMKKEAVKKKSARNERTFKLRFETFPAIVTDVVEAPIPQESMLCEPRQKTTNDLPTAEEDMMRLSYLFDHLRLTQDRIQLWLNLESETYPRHKKK